MTPRVEIIGVYPIEAAEPCHLVELWVRGSAAEFDIGKFTQEEPGQPQSNWQVPYGEKKINLSGTEIVADLWEIMGEGGDAWKGDVRVAFFFHYLRPSEPMLTPFGRVAIPTPSAMPERLSFMKYDAPG
ncbi:MAG: hypothetical protein ABSF26_02215 [Thermoguttaceae bacterium]|jgi:hypothetical protein